jgi:XPB/Ssl2-like helicase family protein/WYL domain-containing protein
MSMEPPAARTLAAALRSASDQALAQLLAERPDLGAPVPPDSAALASRAGTRTSVTRALDRLNRFELNLLEAIAGSAQPVREEDLSALVLAPPEVVRHGMDRLRGLALIWGPANDLRLVRTVAELLGPGRAVPPLRGGHPPDRPVHQPPPLAASTTDPDRIDQLASAAALELARQVEALLESWAAQPPPVLRSGGVGVRELRRTARSLDVDQTGMALLAETALAAGLLGQSYDPANGQVWLPTSDFDAWSRAPVAQQWSRLASSWLTSTRVPGMVGERDERGRPANALAPELDQPGAPELRRLTLSALAELPPGVSADPGLVRQRLRWLRPRRGGLADQVADWTLAEGAAVGLLAADALSAHGRALLSGAAPGADALERQLPAPVDHVLLQADLTAVAPGPLAPEVARALALCADVESRGGATVFRFSEDSVRRALDAGRSAAELLELLRSTSRTPLPQPLGYLVEDVARRHGRLRVGSVSCYIRCDDDALLAEVLLDPRARSLGLRRLAPTVLVCEASADTVLAELRAAGRGPVDEAADGSIRLPRASKRRAKPVPRRHRPAPPDAAAVAAMVRAIRAGDRAAAARPDDAGQVGLPRSAPHRLLSRLAEAAELGETLWIGYADQHGGVSERVVEPVSVEGGWLTAYDHRSAAVRTFAVHRITGAATA